MPETLTPEQIERLAVDDLDLLLSNDDLACPHCGCREFSTVQRGDATQCVIRGEWGSLEGQVETFGQ